MRPIPAVPNWLREYRHGAYTNIYELYPRETRVYGTESLFGDWDAELLLLAKDYAPRSVIEERRMAGERRPFCHGVREKDSMGWRTNENLSRLCKELGRMKLLYGSALGGLLRNDGKTSGRLPDYRCVLQEYSVPLLRWVTTKLPRLKGIACLGNEAFDAVSRCADEALPTIPQGGSCGITIAARHFLAFRLYHPSRAFRGGWDERRSEWRGMARILHSLDR